MMRIGIYQNKEKVFSPTSVMMKAEKAKIRVHENESYDDFISRKMSEMKEEFPDQDQRFAVAHSMWKKERGEPTKKEVAKSMFFKAKYISRKKGKDGKWVYSYGPKKRSAVDRMNSGEWVKTTDLEKEIKENYARDMAIKAVDEEFAKPENKKAKKILVQVFMTNKKDLSKFGAYAKKELGTQKWMDIYLPLAKRHGIRGNSSKEDVANADKAIIAWIKNHYHSA